MIAARSAAHNHESVFRPVEKKYLVDLAEKNSKPRGSRKEEHRRPRAGPHAFKCGCFFFWAGEPNLLSRGAPIGNHPNFGEVFVLAIVTVVSREHLPQFFRELIRLTRGIGWVLAFLMIANAKSRAAVIAELEHFDRVGRIFGNFFVENRDGTV
jgi:hypothetical protein